MLGAVDKEVIDDHVEHPDVVPGQVVLALLLVPGEAGAVVLGQEGLDRDTEIYPGFSLVIHCWAPID